VNRTGGEFFAGAGFALNQHRRIKAGNLIDEMNDFEERAGLSNHGALATTVSLLNHRPI
jgi:hypothetical protein